MATGADAGNPNAKARAKSTSNVWGSLGGKTSTGANKTGSGKTASSTKANGAASGKSAAAGDAAVGEPGVKTQAGSKAAAPGKTSAKKKVRRGRLMAKAAGRMLLMLLLVFIILGFVGVGLVGGYVYNIIRSIDELDMTVLSGELTTYVYNRDDVQIGVFHSEKDRVPLDPMDIPLRMKQAIISIEDQRFFQHKGVDPIRILGAARANFESGNRGQGASTITMQVVRLVILDVGNDDKSYDRKIQEAWLAMKLEQVYSKEQILAFYLNNVYYGQRAYSCATASLNYFNKDIHDLNIGEYAFLAGIVNGPGVFNPFQNMDRAKSRQAIVLNEMVKMGYISESEAAAAKSAPLNVVRSTTQIEDRDFTNQSFLDYTFNEACDILGIDRSNAIRMFTGGYRIYTTLDVVTQAKIEEIYADDENFPEVKDEDKFIQSAMVIVNVHDGSIQSMIGGRNINEVRGFNRAADAYRQPGSAFKPVVVYGPAIELGWGPGNVLDDYPGGFTVEKDFQNSDNAYRGLVTLRAAIQSSLNTIAVKLIERIGVENGIAFAKRLGITSLVESGRYNDLGPAIALGGVTHGISPIELTAAFATYANNGVYNKPFAIRRIEDYKGNVIYEHSPESRVAMSPQTAYMMTDMLISAVSGGTGSRARLDRATAGKTGTTSLNVDAWFAGYTTDLAGVIWMGYDEPERMPGVFGGTYCAPLWKDIMTVAHRDIPVRDKEFPAPEGIRSVTIDAKSGLLPSPLTPEEFIITEKFIAAFAPEEESNVWIQAPVCAESGLLLVEDCPHTEMKTFLRRVTPWTGNVAPQDARLEVPSEFCNIHGEGGFITYPDDDSTQIRVYAQVAEEGEAPVVNLSWYASRADANTVFHIYRGNDPNTPANSAVRLAVLNYTSATYVDDSFEPYDYGTYYYFIQAIDKTDGEVLGTSPEARAVVGGYDPYGYGGGYGGEPGDRPQTAIRLDGARLPYGSGYCVQLLWNAPNPGNDVVYMIYRAESMDFAIDASNLLTSTGNINSYTDTNVYSGHTYYYRVAGVDMTLDLPLGPSSPLWTTIP
ncbi:MAG: PBP1A family penicillin-binding protein [Clostridiales bacterium]|nr:PBP1A family penicillin-binding protein [Clostridiales bacterium]